MRRNYFLSITMNDFHNLFKRQMIVFVLADRTSSYLKHSVLVCNCSCRHQINWKRKKRELVHIDINNSYEYVNCVRICVQYVRHILCIHVMIDITINFVMAH